MMDFNRKFGTLPIFFILQTAVFYRKGAKKACHPVFTLLFYPPHENFSLFAAKPWFSVFNRG